MLSLTPTYKYVLTIFCVLNTVSSTRCPQSLGRSWFHVKLDQLCMFVYMYIIVNTCECKHMCLHVHREYIYFITFAKGSISQLLPPRERQWLVPYVTYIICISLSLFPIFKWKEDLQLNSLMSDKISLQGIYPYEGCHVLMFLFCLHSTSSRH